MLIAGAAGAQPLDKSSQACVNAMNKSAVKVSSTQAKENTVCIKQAARQDPAGTGAEACLVADQRAKIARAQAKTLAGEVRSCDVTPGFAYSSGQLVNEAAARETIALAHDLYGQDLDAAVVGQDTDRNGATCQLSATTGSGRLLSAVLREFVGAKKKGLRDESFADAGSLQLACFDAINNDQHGKIARAEEKLASLLEKKCVVRGVDLAVVLGGQCAGEASAGSSAAAECVEVRVRCRACRLFNDADVLEQDCDLFDNGAADNSCPGCGDGVVVSDFMGTEPASNTPWTATSCLAPNLVYSGWYHGAGTYPVPGVDDAFGFYVNATATVSTLAEAVVGDEYLGFTLEDPVGTVDLNAKKVNFSTQRFSWHAPRRYSLFTSVGGFQPGDEIFTSSTIAHGDLSVVDFDFILPLSGYDAIAGPVEVRLYAHEGSYSHQTSMVALEIIEPGPLYTLNLSAGPGGSVTSDPAGTVFEAGAVVKLQATPAVEHSFGGWTGEVSGLGNPRSITMGADTTVTGVFNVNPPPNMTLGMNLGSVVDWTTSWDFVDVFRMSRTWLTRSVGGSEWDSGMSAEMPTDANGWPTGLPFLASDGANHFAHTLLPAPEAGGYTLILEGGGRIRLKAQGADTQEFNPTGVGTSTYTFTVPPGGEGYIYLEMHDSSSSDDYIRNLRLIRPGFAGVYQSDPFHPLFLQRLATFANLRFMDWGETNASPLVSWSERTTVDTYTQTRDEGVALEHMVALANTLDQDLWICIPHEADDDYVRQTAALLRDSVDPSLKIYVEYSNETWNGIFEQTSYMQAMGSSLGLDPDPWTAGQIFSALRSAQIWEMFEQEFADDSRLVKVLATQSANLSITSARFSALNDPAINPAYNMPDALAVAPYFGQVYTPADIPPAAPSYPTLDDILDVDAPAMIATAWADVVAQKAVADTQGARLVCYEGGQHFVGSLGAENDLTLTGILQAVNRDPRMYQRYLEYLDLLHDAGVSMFGNFSYVGDWTKWGSWGVLEDQAQPVVDAQKYQALVDWSPSVPRLAIVPSR
jgi:hypothetical protein